MSRAPCVICLNTEYIDRYDHGIQTFDTANVSLSIADVLMLYRPYLWIDVLQWSFRTHARDCNQGAPTAMRRARHSDEGLLPRRLSIQYENVWLEL